MVVKDKECGANGIEECLARLSEFFVREVAAAIPEGQPKIVELLLGNVKHSPPRIRLGVAYDDMAESCGYRPDVFRSRSRNSTRSRALRRTRRPSR